MDFYVSLSWFYFHIELNPQGHWTLENLRANISFWWFISFNAIVSFEIQFIVLFNILSYMRRPLWFIYELYLAIRDAHLYRIIDRFKRVTRAYTPRNSGIDSPPTLKFKPRLVFIPIYKFPWVYCNRRRSWFGKNSDQHSYVIRD